MLKTENRLEEVMRKIAEDDKNKMDREMGLNDLVMLNNGHIVKRGKESSGGMPLSDYAMTQALNRIGMPVRYGKKLMEQRPELVADQFNHWIKNDSRGVLLRFRANEDGSGIVRGFLSSSYTRLDNKDVMTALSEIVNSIPEVEIQEFHLDDRRSHLRLTLPQLSAEVGKAVGETVSGLDDILRVGVDIINSEVGASSLIVSPMIMRLVCTNGLRAWRQDGDIFRQRHIHLSSNELYGRMNEAVVTSIKEGDELLEKMNSTRKIIVTNPLDVIESLSKKRQYSQKLTDTLKDNYLLEPQKSVYGIVNSFTRTARDLPNEQKLEVERYAGELLTTNLIKEIA